MDLKFKLKPSGIWSVIKNLWSQMLAKSTTEKITDWHFEIYTFSNDLCNIIVWCARFNVRYPIYSIKHIKTSKHTSRHQGDLRQNTANFHLHLKYRMYINMRSGAVAWIHPMFFNENGRNVSLTVPWCDIWVINHELQTAVPGIKPGAWSAQKDPFW